MKKSLFTFLLLVSACLLSNKTRAQEAPGSDGLNLIPEGGAQLQLKLINFSGSAGTTVKYEIPAGSKVYVKLYNSNGQLVSTLFEGYKEGGMYNINFNSSNLRRGIYICRLSVISGIKQSFLITRMVV